MRTILVATDFSVASFHAAHYAVDMALDIHAQILLLHVQSLPLIISEVPIPFDSSPNPFGDAEEELSKLRHHLEKRSQGKIAVTCQVSMGNFSDAIKSINNGAAPFAVVMGSVGAGVSDNIFMGSFVMMSIASLKAPLLIVPPEAAYKTIDKIGIACDMVNVTETVPFEQIKEVFKCIKATLEVLYISSKDENMYPNVLTQTKFMQINLSGLNPQLKIGTNENIREGLIEFVDKSNIDLLLLIHKVYNFMESLFHKSTAKQMVVHPKIPVMILHQH